MVVIGGELISVRARWRAPDSVLDRSQTVGYTCEITHRSARGRKSSHGRSRQDVDRRRSEQQGVVGDAEAEDPHRSLRSRVLAEIGSAPQEQPAGDGRRDGGEQGGGGGRQT